MLHHHGNELFVDCSGMLVDPIGNVVTKYGYNNHYIYIQEMFLDGLVAVWGLLGGVGVASNLILAHV
jgi:hypothetical protein